MLELSEQGMSRAVLFACQPRPYPRDEFRTISPMWVGQFIELLGQELGRRIQGACVVAVLLFLSPGLHADEIPQDGARRILVLYANDRLLPADIEGERGFRNALTRDSDVPVDICDEFLDVHRFSGPSYEQALAAYLHHKYAAKPPVIIVAGGGDALRFLLQYRTELFPGTPLVHMGVTSDYLQSIPDKPPDLIGVPIKFDFVGTVEQALHSNPGTRKLVVVTGAADEDRAFADDLREEFAQFSPRVAIEFFSALPQAELRSRLHGLTRDTVVFTPGYYLDGDGTAVFPAQAAEMIAAASPAPVYGPFDTFIGTGIVGGRMPTYEAAGYRGGQTVGALLGGTPASSIVLPETEPLDTHVDWRQLRRLKIDQASLPKDTIMHFREPSLWEGHPREVIAAGAVILLLSALAISLARTAQALRGSEQRMVLAAQAAKLAMWVWDVPRAQIHGIIASQPFANLFRSRTIAFAEVLAAAHPDDRDEVNGRLMDAVQRGHSLDLQYRIRTQNGEVRWHAVRGQPDPRRKARWLGVVLDITEQKQIEVQAEQEHMALLHITRVSMLGQMLASISHQLNQPLGAILANAEASQQVLVREPVDLPQLKEICGDIVSEVQRAADVIARLNDLFKRRPMQIESVDLNALVADTLKLTRPILQAHQIAIRTELSEVPLHVSGDRVQLQQVLLNLLVNAADAMLTTPVVLRRVLVRTEKAGEGVGLSVADNGSGIPPEHLAEVFEPFWSSKPTGMGIGLSICRSIVAVHHGTLSAANNPGGGATFTMMLPREDPA